jgi:hypothetical protein
MSGNGRYALPLELFVAPMIPASLIAVGSSARVLIGVTGAVLLAQGAISYAIGPSRWNPAAWKPTWYDLEIPDALKSRPFLFLSLNRQTAAFLAPFLHRDSSFVNMVGQISLALDRPGGARLQALLDSHRGRIRTLLLAADPVQGGTMPQRVIAFQNNQLARVALEVDEADCVVLTMHDLAERLPTMKQRSTAPSGSRTGDNHTTFLSCATKPVEKGRVDPQLAERRTKVDRAFDLLEKGCPRLFSPAGIYTNQLNRVLIRDYVNSDAYLWEVDGLVEYDGGWRVPTPLALGALDDIVTGRVRIECGSSRAPRRTVSPR